MEVGARWIINYNINHIPFHSPYPQHRVAWISYYVLSCWWISRTGGAIKGMTTAFYGGGDGIWLSWFLRMSIINTVSVPQLIDNRSRRCWCEALEQVRSNVRSNEGINDLGNTWERTRLKTSAKVTSERPVIELHSTSARSIQCTISMINLE
jgi:hypothetical protein